MSEHERKRDERVEMTREKFAIARTQIKAAEALLDERDDVAATATIRAACVSLMTAAYWSAPRGDGAR